MKEKWKTAAAVLVVLFCILLGCEKKENKAESLVLTSVATMETDPEEAGAEEGQTPIEPDKTADPSLADLSIPEEEKADCVVHICGAVRHPGVYTLDTGSRIYQVVEAAGGFSENAREDYLNQADPVTDGMKIYVPTAEETREVAWTVISGSTGVMEGGNQSEPKAVPEGAAENGLVNINTAGEALLCTLPGVGSSKAKSIIAYREKNGAYQKIEDVMNVEGIKEGLFQKIRDSITV